MQKVLYFLLVFTLGMAAGAVILLVSKPPAGAAITLQPPADLPPFVVQVDGEVVQPGVFSLPSGSRVQDAIQAAGGTTSNADLSATNLAAKLRDGEHITIRRQGEPPAPLLPTGLPAGETLPQRSSTEQLLPSAPVNLNTATSEELQTLPGIGPTKASDIIAYREAHNGFTSIDEIQKVKGIGPATFERLKELITIE